MSRSADSSAVADEDPSDAHVAQLIRRIGTGDAGAMDAFYRQYQSRIYRFARSRLNDSFAAADVLHETMIEIWKGAKRFEGRSKALTWVLGIANHKVIDQMRKTGREPVMDIVDDQRPDSDAPTQDAMLAAVQDRTRVQNCMARLSEKHRAVLHLAFFEDMAYNDIAAVVGCPEGTVKTRVFHAKEALKRCLMQITD